MALSARNTLYCSAFSKEAEGVTMGYPLTTSSATYNFKVQDAFNQVGGPGAPSFLMFPGSGLLLAEEEAGEALFELVA